jgi:hypothetical protein
MVESGDNVHVPFAMEDGGGLRARVMARVTLIEFDVKKDMLPALFSHRSLLFLLDMH